jgi:hypothetical protein
MLLALALGSSRDVDTRKTGGDMEEAEETGEARGYAVHWTPPPHWTNFSIVYTWVNGKHTCHHVLPA